MNKIKVILLCICSVLLIAGLFWGRYCNRMPRIYSVKRENVNGTSKVSMIALLANSRGYDGKHVLTEGWIRVGVEKSVLYLHSEDEKRMLTLNSVGLVFSQDGITQEQIAEMFDGTYCIVEGDYISKGNLDLDLFSGYITNISYIARLGK